jgi:hypothetical protein
MEKHEHIHVEQPVVADRKTKHEPVERHKADTKVKKVQQSHAEWLIVAFVVITCLTLPSQLLLAYGKETAGFDMLRSTGLYNLIMFALWLLIPASVVCAIMYLWRGKGITSKVFIVVLTIISVTCFVYISWPRSF